MCKTHIRPQSRNAVILQNYIFAKTGMKSYQPLSHIGIMLLKGYCYLYVYGSMEVILQYINYLFSIHRLLRFNIIARFLRHNGKYSNLRWNIKCQNVKWSYHKQRGNNNMLRYIFNHYYWKNKEQYFKYFTCNIFLFSSSDP